MLLVSDYFQPIFLASKGLTAVYLVREIFILRAIFWILQWCWLAMGIGFTIFIISDFRENLNEPKKAISELLERIWFLPFISFIFFMTRWVVSDLDVSQFFGPTFSYIAPFLWPIFKFLAFGGYGYFAWYQYKNWSKNTSIEKYSMSVALATLGFALLAFILFSGLI